MAEVLAVDVTDGLASALEGRGATVRRCTSDEAFDRLDPAATVAVVAPATTGVPLAQAVHHWAPGVPVLYVADDPGECAELTSLLRISPGIARHTRCLLSRDVGRALEDEISHKAASREHHTTMTRLRGAVDGLIGAPPETLSVYLGQLFDHAPIGILLADPTGSIRAANPCSAEVLGWPVRHIIGTRVGTLLASESGSVDDLVERCMGTGSTSEATLTRAGPDGSSQHLVVTVAAVDPEHWNLGVFVLVRDDTARIEALRSAERARQAAVADAERYAELAWTLQESLLPPDLPAIDGVSVAARFHPAGDGSEIGGDFYDVFPVADDEWFAVVGDVCGKGAGAARLTALTRYTLRATTVRTRTIEGNLSDLNAALSRQYELDRSRGEHRFATAAAARFKASDAGVVEVEVGSGGHPAAIVVRRDGSLEELVSRGPLLGVFPTATFVTDRTQLRPGDVLVLYTDGVTEARRGRGEFGEHRLRELLTGVAGRPVDEVAGAVEGAVLKFQAGAARDDIAVLVLGPDVENAGPGPSPG